MLSCVVIASLTCYELRSDKFISVELQECTSSTSRSLIERTVPHLSSLRYVKENGRYLCVIGEIEL